MLDTPRISVIVPVYNTEMYLEKCLSSLAAQTFQDFEVLCINDVTPDNSGAIIDAFAERDPRFIHIQHEKNLGLGGARNTGLRHARADYIASVDSDDWVEPDMLEKAFAATDEGKHDIVCFGYRQIDTDGKVVFQQSYKQHVKTTEDIANVFRIFNPAFWNKLWRRSLYVDNDIYFPDHIYGQDLATTPRILTRTRSINFVGAPLYNYLLRKDSATHIFDAKHFVDYIKVFDVIHDFLHREGLWERYRSSFISDVVTRALRSHSENLLASDLPEAQKDAYLRHLLLLRDGYLRSNHHLNTLDRAQMAHLIGTEAQVADVTPDTRPVLPISLVIKTFLRPKALSRLLQSIGEVQQVQGITFDEILVGDDSPEIDKLPNRAAIRTAQYHHDTLRIRYIDLGEHVGVSNGRNRLVTESRNDAILLCDDDFILDPDCDMTGCLDQFNASGLDMMGGWLKNNYNLEDGSWKYWAVAGRITETDEAKIFQLDERPQTGLVPSDYLLQFFIARRDLLTRVGWAPELHTEEHPEYFYRLRQAGARMALSDQLFVKHIGHRDENPKRYNAFRHSRETWQKYLFRSIEMSGKKVRRMYRWREDEFRVWEVNAETGENRQKVLPLCPPVLDQKTNVTRLTPRFENWSYGYYDTQAVSTDGRFAAVQSIPVLDQLPGPGDCAEIALIDFEGGNRRIPVGATYSWCHQQGAQLQFLPGAGTRLAYNVFDADAGAHRCAIYDHDTGETRHLERPIAALAPSGELAASINFARLFDYRPGYGYCNMPDPFADDAAPSEDGLFLIDVVTGAARLELSYAEIAATLAKGAHAELATQKWVINHAQFSPDGRKLFMLVRTFSDDAPYPTFSVVWDLEEKTLREVFGFGSHYHWRDNDVICISGAPGFTRAEVTENFGVFEVDTRTGESTQIGPKDFTFDGHCSYSPDRALLLYDSYSTANFPYRALYVMELATGRIATLGHFWSEPKLSGSNGDLRCDLHPRWSPDGQTITFDSTHEGFRGSYSITVEDIRRVLASDIAGLPRADWMKWYSARYLDPGRQSFAQNGPPFANAPHAGGWHLSEEEIAILRRNMSLPDRLPPHGRLMRALRLLQLDRVAIKLYRRLFARTNEAISILARLNDRK